MQVDNRQLKSLELHGSRALEHATSKSKSKSKSSVHQHQILRPTNTNADANADAANDMTHEALFPGFLRRVCVRLWMPVKRLRN